MRGVERKLTFPRMKARPGGVLRRSFPPPRRCGGGARRLTGARCALMLAMVCRSAAVCGDNILDLPDEECDDGNVYTGDGCSGNCRTERIAFQTFYNSSDCTGKIWKQLVFDDREYVRSKNANAELRSRAKLRLLAPRVAAASGLWRCPMARVTW
jgi:cysteine-rich repeat protein